MLFDWVCGSNGFSHVEGCAGAFRCCSLAWGRGGDSSISSWQSTSLNVLESFCCWSETALSICMNSSANHVAFTSSASLTIDIANGPKVQTTSTWKNNRSANSRVKTSSSF
jgi:hypothetical protein